MNFPCPLIRQLYRSIGQRRGKGSFLGGLVLGKLSTTLLPRALMPKPVFPGVRNELLVETRHEFAIKLPEPRLQKHVALKKLCVLR